YDADSTTAQKVEEEFGYKRFSTMEDLIEAADMVVVATPTQTHFDCATRVIEAGKHLFIEKPIAQTVEEAEKLRELVKIHRVRGQVGQVERYNPAFMAIKPSLQNPMFIEAHR